LTATKRPGDNIRATQYNQLKNSTDLRASDKNNSKKPSL